MNSMLKRAATCVVFVAMASGIASAQVSLNGAGATFPAPLYKQWIAAFQKNHSDVQIDYQGKGSGAGISGITDKTIDFAGSDAPMSKKEIAKAGGDIVQIPATAGAVVLAYNIPGFNGELKLSGPVLADIFAGKITNWNDPKIAEINPGANLPDLTITPVERGDSSGTNFVFTSYLSTQSDDFKNNVGHGKTVTWPGGQLGQKNDGVTSLIKDNKGAIGYIELNYAMANNIPFATLQNKDGNFVKASPDSVSAAGAAGVAAGDGSKLTVDIWNQSGAGAYPISSFTYIIVYKDLSYLKDQTKAQTLVDFLTWATSDGQSLSAAAGYAPLAADVQKKVSDVIGSLTFSGQPMKRVADAR
jgi:phosphate transport system substrate-binding protein